MYRFHGVKVVDEDLEPQASRRCRVVVCGRGIPSWLKNLFFALHLHHFGAFSMKDCDLA